MTVLELTQLQNTRNSIVSEIIQRIGKIDFITADSLTIIHLISNLQELIDIKNLIYNNLASKSKVVIFDHFNSLPVFDSKCNDKMDKLIEDYRENAHVDTKSFAAPVLGQYKSVEQVVNEMLANVIGPPMSSSELSND